MAVEKIERHAPPPTTPVVPVQPSSAVETPPDGQTGASFARLAPSMSRPHAEAAASAANVQFSDVQSVDVEEPAAFAADPSVRSFAEYLDKRWELQPETGRFNNLRALFSRHNSGHNSGAL